MTTYLLAGGCDSQYEAYGSKLAAEVRKLHHGPLRILSCPFASPRGDWERKFVSRKAWFHRFFGEHIGVHMAMPDNLEGQISAAHVVYLHGGDGVLLSHFLAPLGDPAKTFAGKIVVGSSAGANWLATTHWSGSWRTVRKGRGILPHAIMVHYGSRFFDDDPRGAIDWASAESELRAALPEGAPITHIPEGAFITIAR